ncbi:H-NS histone family protein [Comamonas sp. Y33R10-2]|uniref:H-NS histone family protein n=1 Tax=Comamonas sp. Y33R10-2 TaxID=2853257 RepID=UPI001C5CAE32|nr:H-NS histone family protein [Comamonas sp. Y33R10-2]QXZ09842.1 H-NS histone family protein [Comamonas sp. Y33R10-2]
MPSYKELIARKSELDKRIEEMRDIEAKEALVTIKQLIETFGFTSQQVFPWKPEEKKKVEAKYYDPESGASWTGRGKPPKWIDGKDRSQYEIKTESAIQYYSAPLDENNPFPVQ